MSPEKLVMMANQISLFFSTQPGDAADKIADHLKDFWEPGMRAQLLQYVEAGGEGLQPSVKEAARRL
ncbi:formate dehydrogenase subunit delta [Paracoccus alkanivorans]|uniref:Formate dehydrogenase n=1 Tax=Paracoccus alkanivorans TaxID=2116655 RepID=A0A3M0MK65_9RHOB|nr:formate dehydrogenase subunit delta [Paracoccus alkanivorans]RMC37835.1 formate dehydrogenase [Paracoccus alkanivorans]